MSEQYQALRPKDQIKTCLAMTGELAHIRCFPVWDYSERRGKEASQGNAIASVPEWRSRKVHAAGISIWQSRVSNKTPAAVVASAFADMAYSEEQNTLRFSVESYRRQYSTQAYLNETDY